MPIGKIETFEIGTHNWDAYCRRVKQFIALNTIPANLHVATLVTQVGVACYELMCDLCAPDLPENKTFDQLEVIVKAHLEPQRSEIAERHIFRQRKQKQGETVSEYLQNLKHLAKTCNFTSAITNPLEVNLRDQFVSGLFNEDMRSRLFAEKDLNYKRAVELALSLEAADRHAMQAASGGREGSSAAAAVEPLHSIGGRRGQRAAAGVRANAQAAAGAPTAGAARPGCCWRCGRDGHAAVRCRFRNYSCDQCGEKGHLKAVCRKHGRASGASSSKDQHFLDDSGDSDLNFYNIICYGDDGPYYTNLKVNNKTIKFEIDTGSKISVISKKHYEIFFSHVPIDKKSLRLRSYTGTIIQPLGSMMVTVTFGSITEVLELYVIENGGPPLMGRTWIRKLQMDVTQCHHIAEGSFNLVNNLQKEFSDVFADGLGTFRTPIRLQVVDHTPVFVKARPLPLALRDPVERELKRLQKDGVIVKVDRSDYGTPIVPVIKKNGDIRICGDYKITINPLIKDFHYPLPRIEDIFATLAGGQQFTKLDLSHAYQQLLLTEDSQPLTSITTHVGTFIYKRVPFGIKCIPENFQKAIEETLCGLPSTVVFQDDICVTGRDKNTHIENLRAVLTRLKDAGLRVNLSKCEFFKDSVTYLGYRIDKHGLHTDRKKVEAIVTSPTPINVTQLKSFLGLVNFYARFCKNISHILRPLYNLLKKDVKWQWSKECDHSFELVKNKLCEAPVLAHYEARLPLILSVDSSAYGLGAVLTHRYPDGSERLVSCASRTLNAAETNYSQLDKEALAILFGVTKHHQYVYGRHFILRSDHKALSYIFGKNKGIPQTAASRLQRYAVKLAAYNFQIEYVTSARNCFADFLSRLPLKSERCVTQVSSNNCSYLNFIEDNLPVTFREIRAASLRDPLLNKIISYVKFGWPDSIKNEKERPFFVRKDNLFIEHDCLIWGYRVVIPVSFHTQVLSELHSGHIGVVKMKQLARNYLWWDGLDAEIERVCRECSACAAQRVAPPVAPLHSWNWPEQPWTRLNLDFLGPYKNNYYLIIIDAHSKWLEAERVPSTSAMAVITVLRKIFSRFGLPKCLVSDNGPPFSSSEYFAYLEKNGIKRILVAPRHASSNGAAENAVRTVKQVLKKATVENKNYDSALCEFLFTYRNTEHCTTKKEPAVALLGHRLRGRLDLLRPDTGALVRAAQDAQEGRRGGVLREAHAGDEVLVRDFSDQNIKWKDGVVVERTGPLSYVVKTTDNNRVSRRHIDQIITKQPLRKSWHSLPPIETVDPGPSEGSGCVENQSHDHVSRRESHVIESSVKPNHEEITETSDPNGDNNDKCEKQVRSKLSPHKMTLRPRTAKK